MKRRKLFGIMWLCGAVVAAGGSLNLTGESGHPEIVFAAGERSSEQLGEDAAEAAREKQSLQEEKEQLEQEIAGIKLKKNHIMNYIEKLDEKSTQLSEKMQSNKQEIEETRERLDEIVGELADAEYQKENQYDTMKKRIKYLYENGSDGYLQLILEAESLSDLYSRAEYVSKVTEYDNRMLTRYQETCQSIQVLQQDMEDRLDGLQELKASLKLKKNSLKKLLNKKTNQLQAYQDKLGVSQEELDNYSKQIAEKEEELERLLEQQRKKAEEEAAKREAQGGAPDTAENPEKNGNTGNTGYRWPLNVSGRISSYFGYRNAPTAGASSYHKGIDIAVPTGTTVVAARAGTVITAAYTADAGNYICISHGGGAYTYYMHCSSLTVGEGKRVTAGQAIALSGSTGISTGPHLHFAMYQNGSYVNPLDYVSP